MSMCYRPWIWGIVKCERARCGGKGPKIMLPRGKDEASFAASFR